MPYCVCTEPSGAPKMFQRVVGEREVTFSWSPLPVTQHRGGLLMRVDSKCSVEISSFSEEECLDEIIPASTPDPTPSRKINVDLTPVLTTSRKFNVVSTPDATPSQKFTVDSTPRPNDGPTDSTTDSTGNTVSPGAIIGGIVTVLVILIIAISLIIVVVLILKYRQGKPQKIK